MEPIKVTVTRTEIINPDSILQSLREDGWMDEGETLTLFKFLIEFYEKNKDK